jgi:hypothetical protein
MDRFKTVSAIYLYNLEILQIQVAPGATFKTYPSSTGPLQLDCVTSNHILLKRKKVNNHIFWRSAGGNASEGQGYEFMTSYDTIVSMGAESILVPV